MTKYILPWLTIISIFIFFGFSIAHVNNEVLKKQKIREQRIKETATRNLTVEEFNELSQEEKQQVIYLSILKQNEKN